MSVVGRAKEKVKAREARRNKDSIWYRRVFIVETNNPKDDANVVSKAFGLPKFGYHYVTDRSVDMFALAFDFHYRQISHKIWEVDVQYTSNKADIPEPERPELEEPVYKWGGFQVREVVTGMSDLAIGQDPSLVQVKDSTGILNSAFEPFNPPAEIDRFIPTLTFQRNEPYFNHFRMLEYVNAVNKRRWYGWYPRTVKCASIEGNLQFKLVESLGIVFKYWKVTYQFHFNRETWDLQLLNQGTYYFEGGYSTASTDWNRKVPFAARGVPYVGLLVPSGDKSTSVAWYRRFRVLHEVSFHSLMIPFIW